MYIRGCQLENIGLHLFPNWPQFCKSLTCHLVKTSDTTWVSYDTFSPLGTSMFLSLHHPVTKNQCIKYQISLFWKKARLSLIFLIETTLTIKTKKFITVNSRFKKLLFSFLKLRVVWFKKDLSTESRNRLSQKNSLDRWIC